MIFDEHLPVQQDLTYTCQNTHRSNSFSAQKRFSSDVGHLFCCRLVKFPPNTHPETSIPSRGPPGFSSNHPTNGHLLAASSLGFCDLSRLII
ncbi:hypothetical protein VTI74DRAFT_1150 [Chaetomium olivicolor]